VDAHGKQPELLVRAHNAENMKDVVAAFGNLQFSSDGKLVYFNTPAFATTGAVHVVDTTTCREHFRDRWRAGERLEVGRR
jgi:hypothetical protein